MIIIYVITFKISGFCCILLLRFFVLFNVLWGSEGGVDFDHFRWMIHGNYRLMGNLLNSLKLK